MNLEQIAPLLIALLTGGGINAGLLHLRERNRDHIAGRAEDRRSMAETYETLFVSEVQRLHAEMDKLRDLVVRLSVEVERLGGDPMVIRRSLAPQTDNGVSHQVATEGSESS